MANENFGSLVTEFNCELINMYRWLTRNKLTLNTGKTVAIVFSKRISSVEYENKLFIDLCALDYSSETKYLGMIIDESLSFKSHINYIGNKVSKSLGIMYRLSGGVSENILRNLYYAFIYPYLIYCNLVWGGAAPVHVNRLLLLQKKAVRTITGSEFLDHSEPLFIKTGILKMEQIYKYLCCLYYFDNPSKFSVGNHSYFTRGGAQYLVPSFQRLSSSQRSLSYIVPFLYNSLPPKLKTIDSRRSFSCKLREWLMSGDTVL